MKNVILGIFFGFLLAGCAGMTFGYHYYGLQLAHYDGSLLAPTEELDVSAQTCEPKGSCVVMYTSEFFAMKTEYMRLKQDLNECERK